MSKKKLGRPSFRDAKDTKNVMMRMHKDYVKSLDELCTANGRSRREIVEILVDEARMELEANPEIRLNPLPQ